MSRIKICTTYAAGVAAGLFLGALASSATAAADTATPANPGLPALVEQVITSPSSIGQQLLQTTSSALGGAPVKPATPPPVASATVNLPGSPAGVLPGAPGAPVGAPSVPGLSLPGNLASVLSLPLPNFGGTAPTFTAPSAGGSWLPVTGLP
jgi:hypothetical protein